MNGGRGSKVGLQGSNADGARGRPGEGDLNRSLVRGIEILRAFRPGVDLLGNAELAERTGLAKATVSRLSQTLVDCGLLEHDPEARAYRLAPPVLSFGHAVRVGSPVLKAALPLMREVALRHRVNVGLAAPDREAMVYLESVRHGRRQSQRTILSGQRVPMDLTSLGRAYLATLPPEPRARTLGILEGQRTHGWPRIVREIDEAAKDIAELGYCWAAWQPGVIAVATPLQWRPSSQLVMNISISSPTIDAEVVRSLAGPLLDLKSQVVAALGTTP